MVTTLIEFSGEVQKVIREKKLIIEISTSRKINTQNYDEYVNDLTSYLEFLGVIDIYNYLIEYMDSFSTIEEAINILIINFNTETIKIKCKIPKKDNKKYEIYLKKHSNHFIEEEEEKNESSKTMIGLIGLIICVFIYSIYKLIINF